MSEWVLNTCRAFFLITSSPSLFLIGNTSLHSWMPVVSGSEPPLQENPFRGSSSRPSQFSSPFKNTASSFNTILPYSCIVGLGIKNTQQKEMACLFNYYATWILNLVQECLESKLTWWRQKWCRPLKPVLVHFKYKMLIHIIYTHSTMQRF